MKLWKRRTQSAEVKQHCSSCNNGIDRAWDRCIYCGSLLGPRGMTGQGHVPGGASPVARDAMASTVMSTWTQSRDSRSR